jgi:ABC-type uncharacterized transport system fused permease/ATPase subunit
MYVKPKINSTLPSPPGDYMVGLWDLTCRQYYVRYFIENSWFKNGALYKMNLENRGLRNCDQRVHEDIGAFIGGEDE